MKKYRSYILPIIAAPSVVLLAVEYFLEVLRIGDFLVLLLALIIAAFIGSLIYIWQKIYSQNLIFGISNKYSRGVRRTSLIMGIALAFPVSLYSWELLDIPRYVSIILYLIIWPGIGIFSFIISCTVVCAVFWCIDGFISNE